MFHSKTIIFIGMGVLLTIAAACQSKKNIPSEAKVSPIPVQVDTIHFIPMQRTVALVGNLEPWQEVQVGAQSPGRIIKIYVQEGDAVHTGELLVQMDNAQLTQARINYNLAEDNYKRMKSLYQSGGITEQQLNQAEASYQKAQSEYKLVQQNTQLRAPFAGVITNKNLNEGDVFLLAPSAQGSPSIVTLMDLQQVKLLVNVSEQDFPRVQTGQLAQITVPIYPEVQFTGKITNIRPVIDMPSRTFQIEVQIPNSDQRLRPGMFARGQLFTGTDTVLVVPRSAVQEHPGTAIRFCYIVQNGQAQQRGVSLGQSQSALVEVRKGLQPGDRVIISGLNRLKNGTAVQVIAGKPAGGAGL